ncbi:unnamed protein product [Closterium sp. NIES-53]
MVITRNGRFYDMSQERWQKWHARVGDRIDQPTPPFALVPSLFPEPHNPEQNPPPPRTVIVVPVPSVQGGEQPLDRSVGPFGSKAPTAPPPLDPPSVADSAPVGPEDGPLEVGTRMADHEEEEEEEVVVDEQSPMAHEHEPSPAVPPIQAIPPPPRRSSRPNKGVPPVRFLPLAMTAQDADDEDNPPEGKEWWAAMKEEMESLDGQGTWTLADLPEGRKTVSIKWLLKKKLWLDGTVEKYKARLVAKGFCPRFGINYDDTYAPVGSYTTVRVLLSIAAAMDLDLLQLDVKNAFLHGTIDHEIYMQQPPYFTDGSSKVCLLQKSLYGLKQSPLLWSKELDKVLLVDQALYYKDGASGKRVWLLIYVDDLLAASEDQQLLQDLKELLAKVFQLREVEPVERYLGLQIVCDRPNRTLLLHQNVYVAKQDAGQPANRTMIEYLSILGMVQFAAISTRPDHSFACNRLAADDAGDKENQSSTRGYLFKLGGAAVSWQAKKLQGATKLSSTESELVAVVEAGKDGGKLRFLMWEFQLLKKGVPTTLYVDSMSTVQISQAGRLQGRMKHVDRRHMWLPDMVRMKKLELQHIPTTAQPADFFTKRLEKAAISRRFSAKALVMVHTSFELETFLFKCPESVLSGQIGDSLVKSISGHVRLLPCPPRVGGPRAGEVREGGKVVAGVADVLVPLLRLAEAALEAALGLRDRREGVPMQLHGTWHRNGNSLSIRSHSMEAAAATAAAAGSKAGAVVASAMVGTWWTREHWSWQWSAELGVGWCYSTSLPVRGSDGSS